MRMLTRHAIRVAHDDFRDATIARLTTENEGLRDRNSAQSDQLIKLTRQLLDREAGENRRVNDELLRLVSEMTGPAATKG